MAINSLQLLEAQEEKVEALITLKRKEMGLMTMKKKMTIIISHNKVLRETLMLWTLEMLSMKLQSTKKDYLVLKTD